MICVGVDGCRSGWVAVAFEAGPKFAEMQIFSTFGDLVAAFPGDAIFAVDMPMGLPDSVITGGRGPEKWVRSYLGERQSSVFSIPARAAIHAGTYREACEVSLRTSNPPRKVSKQAYFLFPKIREVDQFLRDNPETAQMVFECHPEFSFWRLNGEKAMSLPKKIKGRVHSDGLKERQELMIEHGYQSAFFQISRPRGVGLDDFLDASVNALVANRLKQGVACPFPDPPLTDSYGLRIAIWS